VPENERRALREGQSGGGGSTVLKAAAIVVASPPRLATITSSVQRASERCLPTREHLSPSRASAQGTAASERPPAASPPAVGRGVPLIGMTGTLTVPLSVHTLRPRDANLTEGLVDDTPLKSFNPLGRRESHHPHNSDMGLTQSSTKGMQVCSGIHAACPPPTHPQLPCAASWVVLTLSVFSRMLLVATPPHSPSSHFGLQPLCHRG
jgi:hypothetical protein